MSSGERPIGATKGKQSDTEALCQPPPSPAPAQLNMPYRPSLCPTPRPHRNSLVWPKECLESPKLSCLHPRGCMQALSIWQWLPLFIMTFNSQQSPGPCHKWNVLYLRQCAGHTKSHQYCCSNDDRAPPAPPPSVAW